MGRANKAASRAGTVLLWILGIFLVTCVLFGVCLSLTWQGDLVIVPEGFEGCARRKEGFEGCARRKEGFENAKNLEFVLIKVSWCGYCKKTEPEWDKFAAVAASEFPGVKVRKVDAEKHRVDGFPTILFLEGDRLRETYQGQRTADAFATWLRSRV
jgi:thiol-disulfide isomerase/thioredoxin